MTQQFSHGYALLIGVGNCSYSPWSLPATVGDANAIGQVLSDPTLCAYPPDADHIRLLYDDTATRDGIVNGLKWLKSQVIKDENATAVIFYSGHGWLNESTGQYCLIPSDVNPYDIPGSSLDAASLADLLRDVVARRLLVVIDSCHAEGMARAKDTGATNLPKGHIQAAPPKHVIDAIKHGEGRAAFTSSRGHQRSWIRPDGNMSIFTYHLVEALLGAANQPGDTVVRLSNIMNHVAKTVPASARQLYNAEQVPFFDTSTEDFPVAMLQTGKELRSDSSAPWEQRAHELANRIVVHIDNRRDGVYFDNQGPVHISGPVIGRGTIKGEDPAIS